MTNIIEVGGVALCSSYTQQELCIKTLAVFIAILFYFIFSFLAVWLISTIDWLTSRIELLGTMVITIGIPLVFSLVITYDPILFYLARCLFNYNG